MLPLVIILLSLQTQFPFISAAPIIRRDDGPLTTGWTFGPDGRGTFSLILSCLLTLSLCVWSAVHLNIPPHGDKAGRAWLRTSKWILLGVVAPELVAWVAWRQYVSAKSLQDRVRAACEKEHLTKSKPQEAASGNLVSNVPHTVPSTPWNKVQCFYAGMGGFVFDLDALAAEGLAPYAAEHRRLTLTAKGVALLAECGLLPNMRREEIMDKSKTDGMGKLISCVQAGWMFVSIVGRIAWRLPITLLEINTLGHVMCAFVIYLLWWNKPRLINEPTKLTGDWVGPMCAYMYMSSSISGQDTFRGRFWRLRRRDPELSTLTYIPAGFRRLASDDSVQTIQSDLDSMSSSAPKEPTLTSALELIPGRKAESPAQYPSKDVLVEVKRLSAQLKSTGFLKPHLRQRDPLTTSAHADPTTGQDKLRLSRWSLAADAIQQYDVIRQRVVTLHSPGPHPTASATYDELVKPSIPNWPMRDLLTSTGSFGLIIGVVLWSSSIAFGSIHLAAWNDYFPTPAERWLWRTSALWIATSGAIWVLINGVARVWPAVDAFWERVVALRAGWGHYVWIGGAAAVCGVAYVFARVFLVVEAFISIRELQVGAYQTPPWTDLIPHL